MRHMIWVLLTAMIGAVLGCNDDEPPPAKMGTSALTPEDSARLDQQRALVRKHLPDPITDQEYETAAGKVRAIQSILDAGLFKAEQTHELQALGVVLGDAFVQDLDAKWVMVNDSMGRAAAVQLHGTEVYLFPVTMVQKRVEDGEDMDVQAFLRTVTQQVQQMKADPEYARPG